MSRKGTCFFVLEEDFDVSFQLAVGSFLLDGQVGMNGQVSGEVNDRCFQPIVIDEFCQIAVHPSYPDACEVKAQMADLQCIDA